MSINVLSLFDGMSCGQIALNRIGIANYNYYYSEIKDTALKVTKKNYPNSIYLGNVLNWEDWDIDWSSIDLLIGGSPCQDLSIAMKERKGLRGEKSKLFFIYYEILEHIKKHNPNVKFLLENVGSMKNKDKKIISDILEYNPININSKLVSAQLRNRYYWTNINDGKIEQPKDKNILLNDILDFGWSDRKKARCILESESRPLKTPIKMFHRYYSTGFTTIVFKDKNHFECCKKHYDDNFKGLSAKEVDEVDCDKSIYNGVRYFTQNELEKLQTIPTNYTKGLTRNQAAGLIGDGWTVDIISHILKYYKK